MKIFFNFTDRDSKKILYTLIGIEVGFALIYLVNIGLGEPFEAISQWFNLDTESTIPSWFSSIQIFCIALIFLIMSQDVNKEDKAFRWFLILVSLVFVFMAVDEAVGIHEQITNILRDVAFIPEFLRGGIWMLMYLGTGLLLVIVFFKQVLRIWQQCRRGALFIAVGLALFLGGGIGLELVSYLFSLYGTESAFYYIQVVTEEFCEMMGMSLVLYGSLLLALQLQEETKEEFSFYSLPTAVSYPEGS